VLLLSIFSAAVVYYNVFISVLFAVCRMDPFVWRKWLIWSYYSALEQSFSRNHATFATVALSSCYNTIHC